ncbi:hypothetical protein F5H01DRAFT_345520 [Linnemannia elongata]|nr:hypothetical protein F5H01DRAFT_345520 [Linnemannia elongata]
MGLQDKKASPLRSPFCFFHFSSLPHPSPPFKSNQTKPSITHPHPHNPNNHLTRTPTHITANMDFFAKAYTEEPQPDPSLYMDSSKYSTRRTGQGYGCESNSHLRRASSGLEADLGQKHFLGFSHHPTHDHNTVGSPSIKNSHQGNERHNISVRTGASIVSHDAHAVGKDCTSPTSPSLHRRTSVSNPCLLHHTNTNGSGCVRPPIMPRTMSSSHADHGSAHSENHASKQSRPEFGHGRSFSAGHRSTIAENPRVHF